MHSRQLIRAICLAIRRSLSSTNKKRLVLAACTLGLISASAVVCICAVFRPPYQPWNIHELWVTETDNGRFCFAWAAAFGARRYYSYRLSDDAWKNVQRLISEGAVLSHDSRQLPSWTRLHTGPRNDEILKELPTTPSCRMYDVLAEEAIGWPFLTASCEFHYIWSNSCGSWILSHAAAGIEIQRSRWPRHSLSTSNMPHPHSWDGRAVPLRLLWVSSLGNWAFYSIIWIIVIITIRIGIETSRQYRSYIASSRLKAGRCPVCCYPLQLSAKKSVCPECGWNYK
jgi:hypothetical protein